MRMKWMRINNSKTTNKTTKTTSMNSMKIMGMKTIWMDRIRQMMEMETEMKWEKKVRMKLISIRMRMSMMRILNRIKRVILMHRLISIQLI
jgi:hypothetical protein